MRSTNRLTVAALLLAASTHAGATEPAGAVRRACPQIDAALQNALEGAARRLADDQRVEVRLRVAGLQVGDIDITGADARLERKIRRAVAQLRCNADTAQPLEFRLALNRLER